MFKDINLVNEVDAKRINVCLEHFTLAFFISSLSIHANNSSSLIFSRLATRRYRHRCVKLFPCFALCEWWDQFGRVKYSRSLMLNAWSHQSSFGTRKFVGGHFDNGVILPNL